MENEITIASRKSRVLAYIIDYSILVVVSVPLMMLMIIAEENEANAPIFLLFLVLFLLYALKDTIKGQSIGKWLLGIGVREQDSQTEIPSISKLFFRNVTQVLGFIEFIVLAVNKDKQRIGDKLAKTVVVKIREMGIWKKAVIGLSAIFLSFALFFTSIIVVLKSTEAYKVSEEFIKAKKNIINETGGIEGFGLFPIGYLQMTNGYGEAFFTIKVKGKEKNIYVDVYLIKGKIHDYWFVQETEYYE
jgi:uncharacterized RDD family membrane protein YckC